MLSLASVCHKTFLPSLPLRSTDSKTSNFSPWWVHLPTHFSMSVSDWRSIRESHTAGNMVSPPSPGLATLPAVLLTPLHHLLCCSAQTSWASSPNATNDLTSFFTNENKNRSHYQKEVTPLLAPPSAIMLKAEGEASRVLSRPLLMSSGCSHTLPSPRPRPLTYALYGIISLPCASDLSVKSETPALLIVPQSLLQPTTLP